MRRILLGLLVCGMAASVMAAADYTFYSTIATGAWWMKSEQFYDSTNIINGDSSNTVLINDSLPINNINFLPYGTLGYKVSKGPLSGCIELGIVLGVYDFVISGNPTYQYLGQKKAFLAYAKTWYVTWQAYHYLSLLIGRDFTPANFFPSNQTYWKENCFNNVGCLYTGRSPMLQLTAQNSAKSIEGKIAAVQPDTSSFWINGRQSAINSDQNRYFSETNLPKFEGSFNLTINSDFFGFNSKVAGGYQTYKNVLITQNPDLSVANSKHPIESWVSGLDLGIKLLNKYSIACDMFYGKNIAAYGVYVGNALNWWKISEFLLPYGPILTYNLPGDPAEKVVVRNGYIKEISVILNAKIFDFLSLEAGAGAIDGTHDFKDLMDRWNPAYAWYFQTAFTFMESMKIVPEVGQFVWGPHKGFGRTIYAGMNTRVDF